MLLCGFKLEGKFVIITAAGTVYAVNLNGYLFAGGVFGKLGRQLAVILDSDTVKLGYNVINLKAGLVNGGAAGNLYNQHPFGNIIGKVIFTPYGRIGN